jgi:chemosensory pili system protein ChpA (sensor histidine kinase/response regulator)
MRCEQVSEEAGMLSASQKNRTMASVATDLQQHVDLVCLDAMEMQRESPDRDTAESILRTLRTVRDLAIAAGAHPVVEAAALVEEAVTLALTETSAPAPYLGHFITSEAADLSRVVHAIATGEDPDPILLHARATLSSMPRRGTDYLVEIDLNNAIEVARIFEAMGDSAISEMLANETADQPPFLEPQTSSQQIGRLRELRQLLASFVAQTDALSRDPRHGETIDALLIGAKALRASASAAGVRSVERLSARLSYLFQSQRALDTPVEADVIEFSVACGHAISEVINSTDPATMKTQRVDELIAQATVILRRYNVPTSQLQTGPLTGNPAVDPSSSTNSPRTPTIYEALQILERAHDGRSDSRPQVGPGRSRGDPDRFIRDLADVTERFPGIVENLERDRASVSSQAALWDVLLKLKESSALAGASVILDQCWRLESSLNKLNGAPFTQDVLGGLHALNADLQWLISQVRPEPYRLRRSLEPAEKARVDAESVDQASRLVSELVMRAGGHPQRSRRFGQTVQDISISGDRLALLLDRLGRDGDVAAVTREMSEIVSDLSISVAELDHLRVETDAATHRFGNVVERLSEWSRNLNLIPVAAFGTNSERAVRGLAQRLGKDVAFVLEGGEIMVNTAYTDALNTALLHLIRNAVDHGIEPAKVRRAQGKPDRGTLRLRARRDGATVVLDVSDDGYGIDERLVLRQATENGYPIPVEGMSRERALQLLFLPGLTTRSLPDDHLAKGHGLDVVGQLVAEMKGTVSLDSTINHGTTVTIRLPLSLPSIESVVVTVAEQQFVLPFVSVQVVPESVVRGIEQEGTTFLADLGAARVPIIDLGSLLGLRAGHHVRDSGGTVLRIQQPGTHWLIKVDAVLGIQDVEIQPVINPSIQCSGVVGSAMLDSGSDAFVLDLDQLLDARRSSRRRKGRHTATLTQVPFALVADMSVTVRRTLTDVLDQEGWRVIEARDGLDAWDLLESIAPELLVIDLDLPLLDPFQVIRAAKSGEDVPVIALVTNDDPTIRAKALSAGVEAVLLKPVDPDDLIVSLRVLGRTRGDSI